jgi:predicted RNA-binding Zn-ribbon protein involved in translation (DUF1610 family)
MTSPPDRQTFPCGQCGAKLEFQPGAVTLKCPYCQFENQIEASREKVVEQDFEAMLSELDASAPREDHATVKCDACAAEVDRPPNQTSFTCPFCGSNIVSQAVSRTLIKPQAVLPFGVTRDQANGAFRKWIGSLWFAPSAVKRQTELRERMQGIYLPHWTYDCKTITQYRGHRGDAYYVTESYSTTVNGKSVRQTRQVRKIRWSPASGTVHNTFDDVLVNASNSLPREYVQKLEPWDLKNAVDYRDDYLAGFRAESYQIDLKQGFGAAAERMKPVIHTAICRDIGGDEQSVDWTHIEYLNVTFKHLLLPVWLSTYRFRNRPFRMFVNARTGEVQGERPYSWAKISAAVVCGLLFIGAMIYLFGNGR